MGLVGDKEEVFGIYTVPMSALVLHDPFYPDPLGHEGPREVGGATQAQNRFPVRPEVPTPYPAWRWVIIDGVTLVHHCIDTPGFLGTVSLVIVWVDYAQVDLLNFAALGVLLVHFGGRRIAVAILLRG